jgi:hypothetical protein
LFNDRSNKYRHENKYCQVPKNKADKVKVKIKVKTPISEVSEPPANKDIMEELQDLRQRVQKMESEPRYNNWIIIGPDMFSEMINRYGRTEALNFLTKSALTGDSVNVIKKLYLDGVSPEKYPIACKNYSHFRYLNDKREVIDDQGGQSVQKIFSDRAHKAMVLAANEMMQDELEQSSSEEDPETSRFRQLGNVQCVLSSVQTLDIDRLAGMINNPNHPFFVDENEVISIISTKNICL